MALRAASRRAQRGAALLVLLAAAVMAFGYALTSRLNAASQFATIDRNYNARVLNQAKQALIGWSALNAASTDANPGRLPCPEAPANFADPANQGVAAAFCTLPAVGRLPWRTLGLDRLVDDAGEPLWYAVSAGWALPNSTTTLTINPEVVGQLSLNGNEAVALVIAPGPAIAVQAVAGCASWVQSRPIAGTPDLRNYLECENANFPADAAFAARTPSTTFNDQLLRVAAADLMPALEAAIADRMQREIAPALAASAFKLDSNSPRRWVTATGNPPIYPYAAPFADPTTSLYRGQSGTYQGLLPMHPSQGFVAYQATPADSVETLGDGYIMSQTCGWDTAEAYVCEGVYHESDSEPWREIRIQMTATFTNVAMGLRVLDATKMLVQARDDGETIWINQAVNYRAEMNDGSVGGRPRGSVTLRFWATMPNIDDYGWTTQAEFRIRIDRAVIADHFLVNADPSVATNPLGAATSWFVRNEWHRNVYYAVAQDNTANVLPSVGGCNTSNCLRFNDTGTYNIRSLLVLAGRLLGTQARPSSSSLDYVEYQNGDNGTLYEQRIPRANRVSVSSPYYAPWNDRVILVDWLPGTPPNATQVDPATAKIVRLLP